ncbi:hypothetical protein PsorP6_011406 [Peronosclerospora sorghi]|uniref:Uncharacterized protein n=1 Tax=Peronosclerospora sorghi TaxID=230839 RepID=A0ACC0WJ71_9STRA|nr:hypothetical protein PsorP6_011406 [Peronosclerospora sorghi]
MHLSTHLLAGHSIRIPVVAKQASACHRNQSSYIVAKIRVLRRKTSKDFMERYQAIRGAFGTPAIAAGVALQLATPGHMQWVVSPAMELQWNFLQIEVSSAPQGHLVKFVGKVKNRAAAESLLPSQAGHCRHSSSAASKFSLASRNRARQSKACAATSLSMASTDDSFCSGSPLAPTSISFSSLSLMRLPNLSLTRARSLLEMKPFSFFVKVM